MKVLVLTLLTCVFMQTDALKCRLCNYALTLDQCKYTTTCGPNMECFMEQLVTSGKTIVYKGGCKSVNDCKKDSAIIGKRIPVYTSICSRCCTTDNCNDRLCGIHSVLHSGANQCYHSTIYDAVYTVRPCQSDEVCGVETFRTSGHETNEAVCLHRGTCTLLTQEALKRLRECREHPDPDNCPLMGRRQSGQKTCSACCGNTLCNGDTCDTVMERLYSAWINGVLDFSTLQIKGTIPASTQSTHTTRI